MKTRLVMVVLLLLVSGAALPQMTPQMQQQLPPNDPSSSQYNSVYLPAHGVGDTTRPVSDGLWEDRWGAIATDPDNAKFGVVLDMTSEREAKTAALQACEQDGGVDCSIEIAFYNQCAVLVTGDKLYNSARGPTVESATQYAMSVCEKGDSNCRVYYSGCSLPVRVQGQGQGR